MGSVAWSREQQPESIEDTFTQSDQHPQLSDNTEIMEEGSHDQVSKYADNLVEFKEFLEEKRQERQETVSRIMEKMKELRQNKEDLETERTLRIGLEKQVNALKEVSAVSNQMLQLREVQVAGLKKQIYNMETTSEENVTTLKNQYEIQIENIRKLKQLYEERAVAAARGHQKELERERARIVLLELQLEELTNDSAIKKQLSEKVQQLETQLNEKESEIQGLQCEKSSLVAQCSNLESQLSIINNLFSNLLTGDMDFDLLAQLLQDNHNLITDLIAHGDINDTAALLVNIAEKTYKKSSSDAENSSDANTYNLNAKREIASNLPKVWRVLIELLSNYEVSRQVPGTSEQCYKNISTPSGSRTVISVSQTFLRLKDLILEKNALVNEVGRLKTLNGHLENRLDLQKKRLCVVSSELRKTWGVVSKLKVQHRQLHTHEKILRYELQHKRQMLTDLKKELVYCRETWDKAREKNTQTEHDWEILRKEFALRKSRDASNSGESGYDDDESSQSPDLSASELEYDISPLSDEQKIADLELEDAASDATVIELIDMLDLDQDEEPFEQQPNHPEEAPEGSENATNETDSIPNTTQTVIEGSSEELAISTQRTSAEIFDARSDRLKRLELQCTSLLNQMAITSLRSDTLSIRLEELHEQYGSEDSRRSFSRQSTEIELRDSQEKDDENDGNEISNEVTQTEQVSEAAESEFSEGPNRTEMI